MRKNDVRLVDYATAFLTVAAGTAVRLYLDPPPSSKTPVYILSILISARFGGTGPGLLATALSVLASDYFFFEPRMGFLLSSPSASINLAVVAAVGIGISVIAGQLRQALRRSTMDRERLQMLSDNLPQFIWTNTADGACDFMNARWHEYTGGAPSSALGSGWKDFVYPEDLADLSRARAEMFSSGGRRVSEFRVRRHDGEYRWFESRVAPMRDAEGRVLRWFGVTTDVDEPRRLRETARLEKERFDQLLATAPGVICQWVLRPDGTSAMPFASEKLREIYGFGPEAVANDSAPVIAAIHPEDRPRIGESIAESARNMSLWRLEYRVRHPEKGMIWVDGRSAPRRHADGSITWFGFITDITERKAAEDLLRQKTEQELNLLKTLVERAPMGLVMLDRSMKQLQASQQWVDDVRMTRESLIGHHHYECFPDLPEHIKQGIGRALAGETLAGQETHFRTPDGGEHWADWKMIPWGDSGETTGGIIIYSANVTGKVLAERAAVKRELEYRALFENMTEAVFYAKVVFENDVPTDFVYLSVNRAFQTVTGQPDVVGKRTTEAFGHSRFTDPELFDFIGRVASTGMPEKLELLSSLSGRWLAVSAFSPGNGFVVVLFDVITERKQAELEARRWQRAFAQSETPIALGNATTDSIDAVNPAYARMLGYAPQELSGRPFSEIYPAEALEARADALRAAEASGHALFESRHLRRDGSEFPVLIDVTAIRDDEDRVVSRVKIVHDLTGIRAAEADLKERERTIRALLDSAAQAIIAVDREGKIVLVNRMAGRMFGYAAHEMTGQPLSLLLPDDAKGRHPVHLEHYFSEPHVRPMGLGIDLRGVCGNGETFPVEVSLSHIETRQGRMAIAFVNNVTERRKAEREIRELNAGLERRVRERTAELEAANAELGAFSYSVSHDLRAPLRGIDGWSLALLEDYGERLNDEARGYLERVRSEAQRMGSLINDLLQLSRVTRSTMEHTPVDISGIAEKVAERLRAANPERSLTFQIEPGLTAPGDAHLMEIAITNLFDNSVKFTRPVADARIQFGESERDGRAVFCVRDNGVGFDLKYGTALFSPFQRLHKASEFPGTGVGLATVKRIVHRHGGEVWAESEPGRGAAFSFTLREGQK